MQQLKTTAILALVTTVHTLIVRVNAYGTQNVTFDMCIAIAMKIIAAKSIVNQVMHVVVYVCIVLTPVLLIVTQEITFIVPSNECGTVYLNYSDWTTFDHKFIN